MYKVMIFGTGRLSQVLEKSLNSNVDIIGYIDNNQEKWGNQYNNRMVICPNDIKKYKFHYILIGSQFNQEIYDQLLSLGIDKKNIFQFSKYLQYTDDYVERSIVNALSNSEIVETLVTGISYAKSGFLETKYKKKSINIAYGSQDLYYDYNLVKYLLKENKFENLKEVIIGLSYYSFQYDMSLSSISNKVILYYKNIRLAHHVKDIDILVDGLDETIYISKLIFNFNNQNNSILKWTDVNNEIDDKVGKSQAELDCKKDYPETVRENIQIFREYLQLLKQNNIKPIVVVFPASKYYTKYFSQRIEDEFNYIIRKVRKEYEFEYIDYFRCDLFEDDDFYDVSHLNLRGAEKFTDILNNII